jgi:hypothetical protein
MWKPCYGVNRRDDRRTRFVQLQTPLGVTGHSVLAQSERYATVNASKSRACNLNLRPIHVEFVEHARQARL